MGFGDSMKIRCMKPADYAGVYELWTQIKGFALRSIDDSEENIVRFLKRNPDMSYVAEDDGRIVGAVLCGHDGRRGSLYHVCVAEAYRMRGIGTALAKATTQALAREGINQVSLVAFSTNEAGNRFWQKLGWKLRDDLISYDMWLNEKNVIRKVV